MVWKQPYSVKAATALITSTEMILLSYWRNGQLVVVVWCLKGPDDHGGLFTRAGHSRRLHFLKSMLSRRRILIRRLFFFLDLGFREQLRILKSKLKCVCGVTCTCVCSASLRRPRAPGTCPMTLHLTLTAFCLCPPSAGLKGRPRHSQLLRGC